MPRNGSGIYAQPFDDVDADTTIESAVYNGFTHDVETDLNQPRPIIAGGTGASSADQALDNLGAEKASQVVTNYDSHVWITGSFESNAATGSPVAGRAYLGKVVVNADSNYIVVEAHDITDTTTPGRVYIREKRAGVWSAWALAQSGAFVDVTGDTMTGALNIAPDAAYAALYLNKPVGAYESAIYAGVAGVGSRWWLRLGDAGSEVGGNAGSNFSIERFNDAGAFLGTALNIVRASGNAAFSSVLSVGGEIYAPYAIIGGIQPGGLLPGTAKGDILVAASSGVGFNAYIDSTGTAWRHFVAGHSGYFNFHASGDGFLAWNTAGVGPPGSSFAYAQQMRIQPDGNFVVRTRGYQPGGGTWGDSSDIRIKNIQGEYGHGLAEILQLRPVTYTYKGNDTIANPSDPPTGTPNPAPMPKEAAAVPYQNSDHYQPAVDEEEFVGLIAQEVEPIMPEMVGQRAGYIDGKPTAIKTLNTTALVYALVNAVKELAARVEELENPT